MAPPRRGVASISRTGGRRRARLRAATTPRRWTRALEALEKRALEPELAAARCLGAAVMWFSRAFAFCSFVGVCLLVAWLALRGSVVSAAATALACGLAYDYVGLYDLLPAARGAAELPVLLEAGALLRGGPREGGRLPGPVLALHARVDRAALGTEASVRLIGDVVVRLARLDKGLLVKVSSVWKSNFRPQV